MYKYLFFIATLSCSCSTPGVLSERQVIKDTLPVHDSMPVLHAYRKKPGQPKTQQVKGYYRQDSTYVHGYRRSRPNQ